jgi:predicted RNase H-like HicB family nuclease
LVSLRAATLVSTAALTFNVVYEDAGESWVYAHVPELPEVRTQGEDLADARAMVMDAIAVVLVDSPRDRNHARAATREPFRSAANWAAPGARQDPVRRGSTRARPGRIRRRRGLSV